MRARSKTVLQELSQQEHMVERYLLMAPNYNQYPVIALYAGHWSSGPVSMYALVSHGCSYAEGLKEVEKKAAMGSGILENRNPVRVL
jgi:hypothetical protein